MKLAIVGSRTFDDFNLLNETVCSCFMSEFMPYHVEAIISGGAKGADSVAKRWAIINSVDTEDFKAVEYFEFPADWESDGKAAGFIRNKEIVNACDMVLAFWDGKSKGTEHTIKLARQAKKPTFIVYFGDKILF